MLFEAELARKPWREVVRAWVPRLAAGASGAATHGVIRAAHAVRAIAERDTAPRRQECSAGLAYWAATYRSLPLTGDARRLPLNFAFPILTGASGSFGKSLAGLFGTAAANL